MQGQHLSVMTAEVVSLVVTRSDGTYVDCTVGGGGHARAILNNAPTGRLLGIDLDPSALEAAGRALSPFGGRVELTVGNFSDLATIAAGHGCGAADGVLFDLGFSSLQLDDSRRGLSFSSDGPLDMRLDPALPETALDVIGCATERTLAQIISDFGEEKRAHPIARAILEARDAGGLRTTTDLANAVAATRPQKRVKTLARVFQALRIAVNAELDNLASGLAQALEILKPGGRVAVISYHSLEDRIVKRHFAACERPCVCPRDLPTCVCGRTPTLRVLTKRVVTPRDAEIAANPRARSAKLRAAEKLGRGEMP
ncbi:MAG: 16S rRNA (cytosine(1402)-N(4))-methyltransferase RsmH [Candidatus Eisenbacteria bacterium]|nr:16S rRNA (cytosine(1402)-N(4))-methyltransferase RsmH [Candidatus Eisenbacteria bacterium]